MIKDLVKVASKGKPNIW